MKRQVSARKIREYLATNHFPYWRSIDTRNPISCTNRHHEILKWPYSQPGLILYAFFEGFEGSYFGQVIGRRRCADFRQLHRTAIFDQTKRGALTVCCTPWKIGNKRAMSKLWRRTTYSTQLTNRGRAVKFVNCCTHRKVIFFNTLNLVYPFNVSTELPGIPKKTQESKFMFSTIFMVLNITLSFLSCLA